ncbi:unnamed protein product [marine sediment metagenome]|uniref:Uncharacterized protein n=1 Tax=marine sediment metagenome TaxID=412755 RepID=X1FAB6_9ZZZZ
MAQEMDMEKVQEFLEEAGVMQIVDLVHLAEALEIALEKDRARAQEESKC